MMTAEVFIIISTRERALQRWFPTEDARKRERPALIVWDIKEAFKFSLLEMDFASFIAPQWAKFLKASESKKKGKKEAKLRKSFRSREAFFPLLPLLRAITWARNGGESRLLINLPKDKKKIAKQSDSEFFLPASPFVFYYAKWKAYLNKY